jgi:hypothetical protein
MSPMGRSLGSIMPNTKVRFRHQPSESQFFVDRDWQTIRRGGFEANYGIEFSIGSGTHAQGYVVRIGGQLFQSPIAAYRRFSSWNVAPGYEAMAAPDFNRPVTGECLLCHSSGESKPARIGCERCHGDATLHLAKPSRLNIVNPVRLPRPERDSVCEQCHLNGEARVENPGSQFAAYRPGKVLEDAYSVLVYDGAAGGLKVVSHVEQLSASACQLATGKLWCGTCHRPHGEPVDVAAQCRACHGSLSAAHPVARTACQDCHMPKRAVRDGGHTAFTDHRIQRRAGDANTAPQGLRLWRIPANPDISQRALGLAYVSVGERDGSPEFINRGYKLLADVYPKFPRDAGVLASLGMVLFVKNQYEDAVKVLRAAVAARPGDALLYEKLAAVLRGAGQTLQAEAALEKAIALDPARETAYHLLADLQSDPAKKRAVLERYLRFNPQSLIAREAVAKLPPP